MEKFRTSGVSGIDGNVLIEEHDGERILIHTHKCFIFKECIDRTNGEEVYEWNISHLETGARVRSSYSRDQVILEANKIDSCKWDNAIEKIRHQCFCLGIVLPLNL